MTRFCVMSGKPHPAQLASGVTHARCPHPRSTVSKFLERNYCGSNQMEPTIGLEPMTC